MVVKKTKEGEKVATGRRIKILREDFLGMTQQEFANAFNGEFTRGALGNWERGEGVKLSNLRAIAQRFGVSLNWLSTGAGDPGIHKFFSYQTTDPSNTTYVNSLDATQQVYEVAETEGQLTNKTESNRVALPGSLPEIDISNTSDDYGLGERTIMNDMAFKVSAEWLLSSEFVDKEARVRRADSVILSIVGDSMFPSYASGDRVIVDLSQRELLQDSVYAITDGAIAPQIKRLQRVFKSDPPRVRIISDNPHYATEEHLLADVEIIGRVCGIIARR